MLKAAKRTRRGHRTGADDPLKDDVERNGIHETAQFHCNNWRRGRSRRRAAVSLRFSSLIGKGYEILCLCSPEEAGFVEGETITNVRAKSGL